MRDTKLVLFEGIPGSGKSTAAGRLHRACAQLGLPNQWWYEETKGNPLHTYHDWPSMDRELGDIFSGDAARRGKVVESTLARWETLGTALADGRELGILDGMLLGSLTWTLFPAGAPEEEITAYLAEAERRVAPAKPCLVYLRQPSPADVVRRVAERRGSGWAEGKAKQYGGLPYSKARGYTGLDGLVAYWEDYQRLADRLFERSALTKHLVTVDPDDWESSWRQIADFLMLSPAAGAAPASSGAALERYAGTYSFTHGDKESRCEVALRDGLLLLSGLPGVWRETPLVPATSGGEARFALESYPFDLTFEVDNDGTVGGAHVSGPPPLFGTMPERLLRGPRDAHPSR